MRGQLVKRHFLSVEEKMFQGPLNHYFRAFPPPFVFLFLFYSFLYVPAGQEWSRRHSKGVAWFLVKPRQRRNWIQKNGHWICGWHERVSDNGQAWKTCRRISYFVWEPWNVNDARRRVFVTAPDAITKWRAGVLACDAPSISQGACNKPCKSHDKKRCSWRRLFLRRVNLGKKLRGGRDFQAVRVSCPTLPLCAIRT